MQTLDQLRPVGTGEDTLDHVVCDCDRDLALCGKDVSMEPYTDEEWDEDTPNMCRVCCKLSDVGTWECCFRCEPGVAPGPH